MTKKVTIRLRNLNFLSKFSLCCLITLALVTFVTHLIIQETYRRSSIQQATAEAGLFLNSVVADNLTAQDFMVGKLEPAAYAELDERVQAHAAPNRIVSINILTRRGLVIYSTEEELVGHQLPLSEDQKLALQGKPTGNFTSHNDEPHRRISAIYPRLLEFSIPISMPGSDQVVGVYQVHKDPTFVQAHISNTEKVMAMYIFVAGVVVYVFLFYLTKRTSKALIETKELAGVSAKLQASLDDLKSTYVGTVKSLSAALDAKDHYTAFHSIQVARLSTIIAGLVGLSNTKIENLEQAALFHDIGKIGIPGSILNKKAALTPKERKVISKHPHRGANIIQNVPFLHDKIPIIRYHHENFDGTGYPYGLRGEEIPLEARILRIADTYDAITSDRPYRTAKSPHEALVILVENRGTFFDPVLVDLFTSWLRRQDFSSVKPQVPPVPDDKALKVS